MLDGNNGNGVLPHLDKTYVHATQQILLGSGALPVPTIAVGPAKKQHVPPSTLAVHRWGGKAGAVTEIHCGEHEETS